MDNLVYYIQTEPNSKDKDIGNIVTATQEDHMNDKNWIPVIVPNYELDDFKKNYKNCVYDYKRKAWINPDSVTEDEDIDKTGRGVITNIQKQLNNQDTTRTSAENNIKNNVAPSLANSAKSDANSYTDSKADSAKNKAVSFASSGTDSLSGQVGSLSKANVNLKATIGSDTGSKISSLTSQFNNFDNTTQKSLAGRISSNASGISNLTTSISNKNTDLQTQLNNKPTFSDLNNTSSQTKNYAKNKVSNASSEAHKDAKEQIKDLRDSLPTEFNNLLNITNISPVIKSTKSWGEPFTLHIEKGKTYFISAHIDNLNSPRGKGGISASKISKAQAYIITYDEDPMDSFAGINSVYIGKFTAPFTGNLPFGFTFINGASKGTFSNICITQSDYYVPFDMAESNRNNKKNITDDQLNKAVNDAKHRLEVEVAKSLEDYVSTTDCKKFMALFNKDIEALGNNITGMGSTTLNQANSYTDNKTTSMASQANSYANNRITNAINSKPNWDDENWTRNNVIPQVANSTAANAMNQANNYTNTQINSANNAINNIRNQISDLPTISAASNESDAKDKSIKNPFAIFIYE